MEGTYWIVGIVLGGLIAVLIYLYLAVRPVLPYLYANTLLQSRSGKFLTAQKITTLTESKNLTEFVNGLTDTFYEVDGADLDDLHQAFTQKYAELLTDVKAHTPKEFTELLNTYALLNESAIVRYLYRSKFLGKPVNASYVYSVGSITPSQLARMQSTDDFAEFKALFSSTIYDKVVRTSYDTVTEFEAAMDNFISDELVTRLSKLKVADKRHIQDLFKMILDKHNVMAVLQGIVRKAPAQLLRGGFIDVKKLSLVKSIDELETLLESTSYKSVFADAKLAYEKTMRSAYVEIAFERYILSVAKSEVLSKPQGAFSILVHILQAKMDQQNVQVISKGIEAKLTPSQIEEMVL